MLQSILHYGIHFILPLLVAFIFYKPTFKYAYFLMLLTMLIDLDHLLASPIFDANRCSINFHSLHSYIAIIGYVLLLFSKKTRLIGLGLCIHILADQIDCLLM